MASLLGKHAVITGGTGAIGLAIAKYLVAAGASVTLLGRREAALAAAAADLSSPQLPPVAYHVVDVTQATQVQHAAGLLSQTTGVHILVNAAGIAQNKLLQRTPDEDIMQLVNTNLLGSVLACKYFTRALAKGAKDGDASIINVSSILAVLGGRGASVYAATKAGVLGLTRSLATELGPQGIRVNALLPGYIHSKMVSDIFPVDGTLKKTIPLRRLGSVDDVAHAALFLAQNTYANNCVLNIDGGLSAGIV